MYSIMGSVIYIKDFLKEDENNLLWNYMKIFHESNNTDFDDTQTSLGETFEYGCPLMDSILISKIKKVEKHLNKELLPTYSFWRMYTRFSKLLKHTDRPSCEITVSVNVKSDKEWPIFIGDKKYIIKPKDGILYYGAGVSHWRDEYDGDFNAQIFLHYVEKNGKYKDYLYDKRKYLGFKQ